MLEIKHLSVKYKDTIALNDLSLTMQEGEIYSLIGPSGCGKTTLLRVIGGILTDFSGNVSLNEKTLSPKEISIGYVPQQYGLLDWKGVKDNIFLPLKLKNMQESKDADEIIRSLEIAHLLNRYPAQLSGGEKQRVALARAFVSQPQILLMDEPFSSLDTFTSQKSQQLFLRLWNKHKVTTLFITHNIHEAVAIGKHILLMEKNAGKIALEMENNYFDTADNEAEKIQFAASIIRKMNYE